MKKMKNTWQLSAFVVCWLSLLAPGCRGGSAPNNQGNQDGCVYVIDAARSVNDLSCGRTLAAEDRDSLFRIAMANNGVTCREIGDTVRLHKLEIEWNRDMQGGWSIGSTNCMTSYLDDAPITKPLEGEFRTQAEAILTKDAYCVLGPSCVDCECGEDLCCEMVDNPCCQPSGCNQRHSTGGVIIAVVASLPEN